MNEAVTTTVLYGHKIIEKPKGTLYRMSDGSGKLFTEFFDMSGDYDELAWFAVMAGVRLILA